MGAYIRAGLPDKATSFDDPSAEPSLHVFNSLIDACAQTGDVRSAWEYVGKMTNAKIAPDLKTLHSLLKSKRLQSMSVDTSPSVDEILNVCGDLEFTYRTSFLLQELAKDANQKEAIVKEMSNNGLARQYIAFASFYINGSFIKIANGPVQREDFFHVDSELCGALLYEIEVTTGWLPEKGGEGRFHAEKKAFCFLQHTLPAHEHFPTIQLSLRVCGDCHNFFRHAATWAKRRIVVHDLIQIHVFRPDSGCSCGEEFRPWERAEKGSR